MYDLATIQAWNIRTSIVRKANSPGFDLGHFFLGTSYDRERNRREIQASKQAQLDRKESR